MARSIYGVAGVVWLGFVLFQAKLSGATGLSEGPDRSTNGAEATRYIAESTDFLHLDLTDSDINDILAAIESELDFPLHSEEIGATHSQARRKRSRSVAGLTTPSADTPSQKRQAAGYDTVTLRNAVFENDLRTASDILRYLRSRHIGFDGEELVQLAFTNPDRRMMKLLIENGVSPDSRLEFSESTLLFDAISRRDPQYLELLLRNGANVNAVNAFGLTPISLAAKHGNIGFVRTLYKEGADPNLATDGKDPLTLAVEKNDVALAEALLLKKKGMIGGEPMRAAIRSTNPTFHYLFKFSNFVSTLSDGEAKGKLAQYILRSENAKIVYLLHRKFTNMNLKESSFFRDMATLVRHKGDQRTLKLFEQFGVSIPAQASLSEVTQIKHKYNIPAEA